MAQNALLNNRYRLIDEEGTGGMAVVYKAQDLQLDRVVAVKVLKPNLTKDPEFIMRFREEARAAANLSHPNIVTVYDFGQDDRTHYIVFEYVEGQNLKEFIRDQAPFDVGSTLLIMIELCKGLGYAHRAGFVHADVKPQNVLITDDRLVKLTDFGLARALTASHPGEPQDVVWGSPSYLSPERIMGEPPTPPSDVYSLGVVMFELLTGKLPFTGADYEQLAKAHLYQEPPDPSSLNPMVPLELDNIVRKLLSKEPSRRYRTADQLGRILLRYRQQGEEATASFPVTPSQPRRGGQAARQPEPEPEPDPVLEPLDISKYTGQPSAAETAQGVSQSSRQLSYAADPASDAPVQGEDGGSVVIDAYGIVLGLLTLAALLGLIPLWIAVFNSLSP